LSEVMPKDLGPYFETDFQYASSWALCWMLNRHPKYREAFGSVAELRMCTSFMDAANSIRDTQQPHLSIDWLLFVEDLVEGYDTERSWPQHSAENKTLPQQQSDELLSFAVKADRGWQDTGLRLQQDESVRITCDGRYQVNETSKPWISEPQGVSIQYVRDVPLGQVIGILVSPDGEALTRCFSIGREADITAPFAASLWLQINDTSNSRHDNDGQATVLLRAVP